MCMDVVWGEHDSKIYELVLFSSFVFVIHVFCCGYYVTSNFAAIYQDCTICNRKMVRVPQKQPRKIWRIDDMNVWKWPEYIKC